jgi:U3 small nucleolar RNA-associated protein 13
MNYLALHDYRRAIELALAMDQPGRLFSLFKDVLSKAAAAGAQASPPAETIIGHPAVDQVIQGLSEPDLAKLLLHIRSWNTQAKSSEVAQKVLFAIIKLRSVEDVMRAFNHDSALTIEAGPKHQGGLKDLLDALIPYTERHLARMEKLVQDSYVVDYILGEMDDGMLEDEISDDTRDGMDVETVLAVDVR